MVVITANTIQAWGVQDIVADISTWFRANPNSTVAQCIAGCILSASNVAPTAQQVYWVLQQIGAQVVPETDSEYLALYH